MKLSFLCGMYLCVRTASWMAALALAKPSSIPSTWRLLCIYKKKRQTWNYTQHQTISLMSVTLNNWNIQNITFTLLHETLFTRGFDKGLIYMALPVREETVLMTQNCVDICNIYMLKNDYVVVTARTFFYFPSNF